MSLIQKVNAVGIDAQIQRLQTYIYDSVIADGWTNYQSYERDYKTKRDGNIIPEIFRNNEYVEVLLDDKRNANSFFLTDDTENIDEVCTINVSLIFQVNLNNLYASAPHRADEEFRSEIKKLLYENPFGFTLTGVTTGIDKVYSDLSFPLEYKDDMQQFHVVRFDLELNYNIINC
jgi:hypothetical protein